jgi:putative tryptophan/tyrosine transport system substrate-binding protein
MKTIGFLNSAPKGAHFDRHVAAFLEGLKEAGCVEGRNVKIVSRWAQGKYADLPKLAAGLVKRKVDVLATTGGTVTALAALKATKKIPILFVSGFDPHKAGLLKSGNAKGVHVFTTESVPKRLAYLRQLTPKAKKAAVLLRPGTFVYKREKEEAKKAGLIMVEARDQRDFAPAFAAAVKKGAGAIMICADPYFTSHRKKLIALAAKYGLPAAYPWREYVEEGGLMSFGPNLSDAYRHVGLHAGYIVQGTKERGKPIKTHKLSEFELAINAKTAQQLGLATPKSWEKRAEVL